MSVLHLLSATNFITVNRDVAKIVGLESAVILGELASEYLYWQERGELNNGYFYSTIENLEAKTFLSAYEQRIALNRLQTVGWIDVKKKGMPAKRYIRIFEDKICEAVYVQSLKILTTSGEKISQQVVKNFDINKNIENKNIKEENSKDIKENRKRFIPPTIDEINAYCKERNNNVDAKKFFEYYEAGDWKDSKGNPVKNWKQKMITWEKQSGESVNRPRRYKSSAWRTGAEAGIVPDDSDNTVNDNDNSIVPEDVLKMFGDDEI